MSRAQGRELVAGLAISETVSWGVLYYAFAVLLGPIQAEMGWSLTAVSGAFSLALLVSAVAAPVAGWVVDRQGARGLMTGGALAAGASLACSGFVTSLPAFYASWAVAGAAMAAVLYEPAFAVLSKAFGGDERRRALTFVTLVAGLASTIFVPLTTALVLKLGWRNATCVLAALIGIVVVPIHARVLTPPPSDGVRANGRSSWRAAAGSGRFMRLAVGFSVASLVATGMNVHAVSYFEERGLPPLVMAAILAAVGVTQVVARLAFSSLASRLSPRWQTPATFLVQGLGMAALVVVPGMAGISLFVIGFGTGNGLVTLTRATAVADEFGADDYGTIAGLLATPATVARAAGPVTFATLAELGGGYSPVLLLSTGALVLAALVASKGPSTITSSLRRSFALSGSRTARGRT